MSFFLSSRSLGKTHRRRSSAVPRNPGLLTQHPGKARRRVEVWLGSLVEWDACLGAESVPSSSCLLHSPQGTAWASEHIVPECCCRDDEGASYF